MLKQKWILGNWKMNGRQEQNQILLDGLAHLNIEQNMQVGIAPPYPYLHQSVSSLKNTTLLTGAQDISAFAEDGAYTGEVSAAILKDCGISFTLIGHSERRQYFKESNDILAKKLTNAHNNGLTAIFCVGEDLQQREANKAYSVVSAQLDVLDTIGYDQPIIVAYEPVWAIGTGKVATLEQIEAMHQHIYSHLLSKGANTANIRVLYGGSVNVENAATIFATPKVDGVLVGGASLNLDSFTQIIKVINK
ncbi:triose-phosphate isomerase [Neisseria sp. Ec49-e6-T10]|uniref:triose-phosphate isomerase n=1 Tax=Neisseria sp. Ec49-e6-T10 TaxID=3140744 RepID=UPI003EB7083E